MFCKFGCGDWCSKGGLIVNSEYNREIRDEYVRNQDRGWRNKPAL